ncbi:MAG: MarR family transcriptional regulator [Clostridiales Family XIII bacterium]|jgi:DNA-binding MarR family transcriptional regulator|nr:MarR family transcriptional regulator [Clostridiales Family XIII bacterium]
MDSNLKEQYIQVLFRFKKAGLDFPKVSDVNMTELFVMAGISENAFCGDKSVNMAEIQSSIYITKAAISQMFTSLEKKGYVVRETDRSNRRKITVELTDAGSKILEGAKKQADQMLEQTLSRLGEENAWRLITLLNRLSDIFDEVKQKISAEHEAKDGKDT